MKRQRLAIVTPWYGEECKGGAELLARELATHLSLEDDVTVLTTTSRSFLHAWDVDYHRPGRTTEGGYGVTRFSVRLRNHEAFNRVNDELLSMPKSRWGEIVARRTKTHPFIDESINSPALEEYLRHEARSKHDAVLFLPYLYGVVIRGIECYEGPAHLVPCLHDEAYARIARIEDTLHKAASLLFNSAGEAELALQIYGPGILAKSHVIGSGVPLPTVAPADSSPATAYYLYVGRRDTEKGVDDLVGVFRERRADTPRVEAELVLVGPGEKSYDDPPNGIRDLGFVDEATKRGLIRNAIAVVSASRNESYSRAVMEAWREETPVVVHAQCLATAVAVAESGGGFAAATAGEWTSVLTRLEKMTDAERRELGRRGAAYAAEYADWDKAVARTRAAIGLGGPSKQPRTGKRIDQVVEGIDNGDAISDYARHVRRRLRNDGYDSTIFAANIPPGISDASPLKPGSLNGTHAVIYHHSIGSKTAETVLAASCRKAMIYHNITPARFFESYAPLVARQLEDGRKQLASIAGRFDLLVADSQYNASEIEEFSRGGVRTIPVVTDFRRLDVTPDARVVGRHAGTTWLFVGRVASNKGIGALIDAFEAFLALEEDASLVIAGKYDRSDRYYNELQARVHDRHLDAYITFTGYMSEAILVAYYRSASVFVCMSEHEGFCVPLVEAMFYDIPIVAKATSAVPGTLGGAGLMLEPEASACEVAALVHEVCVDAELRERVIDSQRERRRFFLPGLIDPLIDGLAKDLV